MLFCIIFYLYIIYFFILLKSCNPEFFKDTFFKDILFLLMEINGYSPLSLFCFTISPFIRLYVQCQNIVI